MRSLLCLGGAGGELARLTGLPPAPLVHCLAGKRRPPLSYPVLMGSRSRTAAARAASDCKPWQTRGRLTRAAGVARLACDGYGASLRPEPRPATPLGPFGIRARTAE